MDVTIQHGRAVFAPFTPDEDKDPQTKKFGIKAYNKIIGVILKVFGIAERIDVLGPENKSLYVNKNSFKDWQRRHEINRKITKHLTPEEFIKDVVSLAQLNKQIKTQPTSEAYFERAKFYFNHKDFSKGEEDLNRAILENPTTGKYAEEYIYFLLSKAKDDKSSKFNALKDALQVTSKLLLKDPDYRFTSEGKFYAGKPLLLVRAALYNEIHNLKSDRYRLENKKGLNDEKKEKDYALESCNEFLANHPNDSEGLIFRASLHKNYEDFESALEDLDQVFEIPDIQEDHKIKARIEKAKVYSEMEDYQNTLKELKIVERTSPQSLNDPEVKYLKERAELLFSDDQGLR